MNFFDRMWDWALQHPYLFTFLAVFYLGSLRDNAFVALNWMQDLWKKPSTAVKEVLSEK